MHRHLRYQNLRIHTHTDQLLKMRFLDSADLKTCKTIKSQFRKLHPNTILSLTCKEEYRVRESKAKNEKK